ncbi:MAG: hypothetical protein ACK40I_02435 [Tabrizicola sp.]
MSATGQADSLGVTTMGEFGEDGSFPVVADYGVNCRYPSVKPS